jgi:pSer/pThr/pTyr-binding forkhead associated (FHA) protein
MEIRLLLDSEKQVQEKPLSLGVYLVGRSQSCQIRPKSKSVSRKHCAIIHKADRVLLQDIGSKHGTYVNDHRLDPGVAVELADGDRIRAGRVRFRIAILNTKPEKDTPATDTPATDNGEKVDRSKRKSEPTENHEPEVGRPSSEQPAAQRALTTSSPVAPAEDVPSNKQVAAPDSAEQPAHVIDDILSLIEADASDIENSAIDMVTGVEARVDLEELEDDAEEVEFAAPRSNASLSEDQPVPSYQLRQDWDVSSVHNYVSKSNAPPTIPTIKFKPKKASKAQKAEERERQKKIRRINGEPERNTPAWLEWIETGIAGPILVVLFAIALIGWVAYNIFLLYSFKG